MEKNYTNDIKYKFSKLQEKYENLEGWHESVLQESLQFENELDIYKESLKLCREYMFKVMCAEDVPSEEWFIECAKEENNRLLETIKAKDKEIEKQSEIIQETATTTYHKLMEKDIIFHLNKHKEELEEQVVKQEKELEYIQKQLEEKETEIKSLTSEISSLEQDLTHYKGEVFNLKDQLAESERLIERLQQIIDKLRDKKFDGETLVNAVNYVYEPLYQNKYDEVEELKKKLKKTEKLYSEALETVDSLFTNQDKIEFTVEQLEKVKEFCDGIKLSMIYISQEDTTKIQTIIKEIDNQIEQLKKEMK